MSVLSCPESDGTRESCPGSRRWLGASPGPRGVGVEGNPGSIPCQRCFLFSAAGSVPHRTERRAHHAGVPPGPSGDEHPASDPLSGKSAPLSAFQSNGGPASPRLPSGVAAAVRRSPCFTVIWETGKDWAPLSSAPLLRAPCISAPPPCDPVVNTAV